MAQFSSQIKLLPSREVQESLLNCVEEGTTMVTSLVDGSLSLCHHRETIMLESDQLEKTKPFQQ
jgi:hypothetical protein